MYAHSCYPDYKLGVGGGRERMGISARQRTDEFAKPENLSNVLSSKESLRLLNAQKFYKVTFTN